ncbi:MAG TPA: SGNH/GDSL hydrolase family protein [Chthoniobacterales bacterium]|jgi:lysophospholipase L1-like esterase|nr:SGNH/GDSL hydrolase family protein [Chthoniobacterales bacterium]
MKSTTVITEDFLERISQPESRYHSDYVAYRRGEVTRAKLINCLPHIAMIGDSVCTGIHVSTPWATFWRARSRRDSDWFLNVDDSPQIQSVSKRLEKLTPLVASHYGGIGAMIDDNSDRLWLSRRILGTRNFSAQIDQLIRARRFPDLVLISIGHNNVDWAWRSPRDELENAEGRLQRQRHEVRKNFARRLRNLIEHARKKRRRVAIVVFGLVNFGSYFKGRAEAERLRAADRTLYPHLETTYKYLISFRPDYRGNVIRLAEMVNDELRMMIDEFNREFEADDSVQLRYSDALATADLSRAELLHHVDGWHASAEGHNVLAEAVFRDLAPSLEFLRIV